MVRLILKLRYKICNWLFMRGHLREVISHYDSKGISELYAFGFSLRRRWKESE